MMLSPSSFRRSKMGIVNVFTTSDNTLVSNVVISCIDIILTLARYYFVLLILIAVFALIMHRCYFSQTKAANALFFIITGILSIIALIFAPSYTWDGGRAYFGGITFLIIALIILLPDDYSAVYEPECYALCKYIYFSCNFVRWSFSLSELWCLRLA